MMKRKLLKALNLAAASLLPPLDRRRDRMVVLAFHSVLPDMSALEANVLDPYQPLTLADVETVATTLQQRGYRFVTGRDLASGSMSAAVSGPAAWLTFDDGYANNLQLAPLLQRLGVPATIFVATANVDRAEAYWWDVLFRESQRRGVAPREISLRREALKTLAPDRIRAEVSAAFGEAAFRPTGDLDRPMTAAELSALAANPLIEIGNHTHLHTILPRVDARSQRADIATCQNRLTAITGRAPTTIAYPNGNATGETLDAARSAGLSVGVTCTPRAFALTARAKAPDDLMEIGRFAGLHHGVLFRELKLATARLKIGAA
jgi:peptidoglycan/xylan/chitin deacetylase (PgdA/CDA1 family)